MPVFSIKSKASCESSPKETEAGGFESSFKYNLTEHSGTHICAEMVDSGYVRPY